MTRLDAYRGMMADHTAINGEAASIAYGVGNNMSYAFYTDNGHELGYWSKGLPGCGGADTQLYTYPYAA